MALLIIFTSAFLFSFIGSLTPSMLNMSALKTSLEKGTKAAFWFSVGVSFVVLIQAYIAVILTKYIIENPMIIEWLEKLAVVIFIILSVHFYVQSKKQQKQVIDSPKKEKNKFLLGVFLSLLNMFAIPFYCGIATSLDVLGWMKFDITTILFFILGSAIGTLGILLIYVKYAQKIQQKTGKLTKDMNLILSLLTSIVAVFSIVKLAYAHLKTT